MPDWKHEVRAATAHLNLEPGREESIVEELAEHLHEQYEDLLENDVPEGEAYRAVMEQLNKQNLDPRLCRVLKAQPTHVPPPGRNERSRFLPGAGKRHSCQFAPAASESRPCNCRDSFACVGHR